MPKRYTDEDLENSIIFFLNQHRGGGMPINRWDLVEKIYGPVGIEERNDGHYGDRTIRDAVERLRKSGVLICDMANGSGRFLAANLEEYQQFRMKYGSRAFAIMDTLREMDKAAQSQWEEVLQPRML